MSIMDYETPGLTKIEFEDSLFVTTELNKDENKEVKGYIERVGGIIKNSVTKTTNYLIYKDGKEETTKYNKALELVRDKGLEIGILPLSLFYILCKGKELIEFGTYPFEADGTRRPIKWVKLRQENGKALLFSAYGIDVQPYNEKYEKATWEYCTLRKWLNEDFYNDAFTEEEKKRIRLTTVSNPDNPRYGTKGGNDTEDRIFLLSISEAETLLPEEMQRRLLRPPLAGAKYGYLWWWLRSPGNNSDRAAGVSSGSDVSGDGNYVSRRCAVCPALWIDPGSEIE